MVFLVYYFILWTVIATFTTTHTLSVQGRGGAMEPDRVSKVHNEYFPKYFHISENKEYKNFYHVTEIHFLFNTRKRKLKTLTTAVLFSHRNEYCTVQ